MRATLPGKESFPFTIILHSILRGFGYLRLGDRRGPIGIREVSLDGGDICYIATSDILARIYLANQRTVTDFEVFSDFG